MTWIEEYLAEGEAGRINIPKRVRKQYQQLLPIIRGEDPRWYYNEHLAAKPIEFGERFCRQSRMNGAASRSSICSGRRPRSLPSTA